MARRCVFFLLLLLVAPSAAAQDMAGTLQGELNHPLLRRFAAAVYLENLESHPDYAPSEANPVMDQVNLRFTPHVLPVLMGSTIEFPNSDETRHNVYTSRSSVCQFELGIYPAGEVKQVTCDEPGVIMVLCNVHAEMRGFVIVAPSPFFTTTNRDGQFKIEGVPPGQYRAVFQHERLVADPVEIEITTDQITEVDFGSLRRGRRQN